MTSTFEILTTDTTSQARAGRLYTPHGTLETPAFIFCATKASIKAVAPYQMREAGTEIILSNTYHLMLQPGADVIEAAGGLHRFMGWNGPLLTDSGGFQVFSLGSGSVACELKGKRDRPSMLIKISEEGAFFKSYRDGSPHCLTPEKSIQIQRQLGADLIVVLDECTPFHVSRAYTERSLQLSHRWALRSLKEFQKSEPSPQALYGIIQGGVYRDLRLESGQFVGAHPFFGTAIGGSLGKSPEQMLEVVAVAMEAAPKERPTHLLGIGDRASIFAGVCLGIDTFDCVHPTRIARHGNAMIQASQKPLNLLNSRYQYDQAPLEEGCCCHTCQCYTRSYLHHLLKAKELLAYTLLTIHNVCLMNRMMAALRQGIRGGTLKDFPRAWGLS